MIIGVLKETKSEEYRVGAAPMAVAALVKAGHRVLVEAHAGEGSSFGDEEYRAVGASIAGTAEEVWRGSEMIYHVKEPLPEEYKFLRPDLILFTFLHLAPEKELTSVLLANKVTGIAYETVETPDGMTPLLDPMSAVAGRESVVFGSQYLGRMYGGSGKLVSGIAGVQPATVVVVGGGVVGSNAARIALGLGGRVILLDIDAGRLSHLEEILHGRFETLVSNYYNLENTVKEADLLIGCVLVKGARAPRVVTEAMVKTMKPGSVIVDVSIDQGGCIETSRPTTHAHPVFTKHGVIHYCVTNMPSMYPRTSTIALSNVTLPYALKIADMGFREAVRSEAALLKGLNTCGGKLTNRRVAEALGIEYFPYRP
jgi:alanine dehydrogenase